jgi:hypothetical protein
MTLRCYIGDIGVGFEGKLGPGIIAIDGSEDGGCHHHKPLAQRKGNNPINH